MEALKQRPVRVVIIGAGNVGATCAYALLLNGVASEIVLVDVARDRAEGEAMDLNHGMTFTPTARVWAGDYADCAGADIVVLTAGANQKPGETRLDLARRNAGVFRQIIPQIVAHTREAILVVTTNPVDVLTYVSLVESGLPPSQVIGSGTTLDSARFRYLLGERFHVDPRSVHGFIIGEHGDSQVPVWSHANIAGMRLDEFCRLNDCALEQKERDEIARTTRTAAYEIIRRKGATYYAIAAGLVRIIQAIVRDEHSVLSVSSLVQGRYGLDAVCLSLPSIVNRGGIARVLELALEPEEHAALAHSAGVIREAIASLSG